MHDVHRRSAGPKDSGQMLKNSSFSPASDIRWPSLNGCPPQPFCRRCFSIPSVPTTLYTRYVRKVRLATMRSTMVSPRVRESVAPLYCDVHICSTPARRQSGSVVAASPGPSICSDANGSAARTSMA